MTQIKTASLRESIGESIGNFLYEEGFANDDITKYGILEIINLISDYHEEGSSLFPEILITNNLDFLKTIPNKEIIIIEATLTIEEFKKAIKLCAPLAINSWIIFIEIKNGRIKYGITSAELAETSPSIYNQTVGHLKIDNFQDITIAYIRNIGKNTVELAGLKNRLIVSLTLDEAKDFSQSEIPLLVLKIAEKCDEKIKINITTYFEKLIDEALKRGHGNLIGIIDDSDQSIQKLKDKISGIGGIYLPEPIDFELLIKESETNTSTESSTNLRSYSSVLKAMLNHDGITIISNKARVIGYHILIDNYLKADDKVLGGARSKAFKSMENSELFIACFYKSQDGNIKLWEKE